MRSAVSILAIGLTGCVTPEESANVSSVTPKEFLEDSAIFEREMVLVSGWVGECGAGWGQYFQQSEGDEWCDLYSSKQAAEQGGTKIEWPLPVRFANLQKPEKLSRMTFHGQPIRTCLPQHVCVDYIGFFDAKETID